MWWKRQTASGFMTATRHLKIFITGCRISSPKDGAREVDANFFRRRSQSTLKSAIRISRDGGEVQASTNLISRLGDSRDLNIVSNKIDFLRKRNPILFAYSLLSRARKYERFLETLEPEINPGFFRQYLDLVIRKP